MEEEKSYQDLKDELIKKYKNICIPQIAVYEEDRKKFLKPKTILANIFLILYILATVCAFLAFIFFVVAKFFLNYNLTLKECVQNALGIFVLPIVLIMCISLLIESMFKKIITSKVKNKALPLICNCFQSLKYVPNRKHSTEAYENAMLFPKVYTIKEKSYDDCYEGKYKDTNFIIEECHSENNINMIIIQFEITKGFKGKHVIYPNSIVSTATPPKHLSQTKLEDFEFNEKYVVYTNNETELRYLLTPSFIERLKSIKTEFDVLSTYISFYNGVFFLGLITKKDLFEISNMDESLYNTELFSKMVEEIISILKLIDHFKLDQKIGM